MNPVDIRISDQAVVSGLSRLAEMHQRSIEAEAIELIRLGLAERARVDRLTVARSISGMTPNDRPQADSSALIREDRDRDG